jgi:hypothetical protein
MKPVIRNEKLIMKSDFGKMNKKLDNLRYRHFCRFPIYLNFFVKLPSVSSDLTQRQFYAISLTHIRNSAIYNLQTNSAELMQVCNSCGSLLERNNANLAAYFPSPAS